MPLFYNNFLRPVSQLGLETKAMIYCFLLLLKLETRFKYISYVNCMKMMKMVTVMVMIIITQHPF